MGNLIGITGTPGTGKKSIAPLVASKLGLPCLSLSELAATYGLLNRGRADEEVDTKVFAKQVAARIREPSVVYGHLLPYVLTKRSVETVVVLRCEPSALRRRLVARGYSFEKVFQNVEAELIGVVASDSYSAFGPEKTTEFDTSDRKPDAEAKSITNRIRRIGGPRPRIDWTLHYNSAFKLRSLLSGRGTESALT